MKLPGVIYMELGLRRIQRRLLRYYRMAEKQGVKSVGLSWIWKEKYDDKEEEVGVRRAATEESLDRGHRRRGRSCLGGKIRLEWFV